MDFRTRVGVALLAVSAVVAAGFVTLGPAPRFTLFLALTALAYAYGPTVWNGASPN